MISAISDSGLSLNRLLAVAAGGLGAARRAELPSHHEVSAAGKSELTQEERAEVERHLNPETEPKDDATTAVTGSRGTTGEPLTEEEQRQVRELKQRDLEVRRHEQAHKAAAGSTATSAPTYEYETGPDGKRYAVGGEVQIDTAPESDPRATIAKMQQVRRAALAPAEASAQDRKVAAQAAAEERKARAELREQQAFGETGAGLAASQGMSGHTQVAGPFDLPALNATSNAGPASDRLEDSGKRATTATGSGKQAQRSETPAYVGPPDASPPSGRFIDFAA